MFIGALLFKHEDPVELWLTGLMILDRDGSKNESLFFVWQGGSEEGFELCADFGLFLCIELTLDANIEEAYLYLFEVPGWHRCSWFRLGRGLREFRGVVETRTRGIFPEGSVADDREGFLHGWVLGIVALVGDGSGRCFHLRESAWCVPSQYSKKQQGDDHANPSFVEARVENEAVLQDEFPQVVPEGTSLTLGGLVVAVNFCV